MLWYVYYMQISQVSKLYHYKSLKLETWKFFRNATGFLLNLWQLLSFHKIYWHFLEGSYLNQYKKISWIVKNSYWAHVCSYLNWKIFHAAFWEVCNRIIFAIFSHESLVTLMRLCRFYVLLAIVSFNLLLKWNATWLQMRF